MIKINVNKSSLQMFNNPYQVMYSNKVEKAIRLSIKKGLLEKYEIDNKILIDYFNKKRKIPIWIIEAACEINKKNIKIPAQYQFLWYCLHDTILTRKQPSGKVFYTKVNFYPCYLNLDHKLEDLLKTACKTINLPIYKFINLCGYKKINWQSKKRIPLISVLKICQILKIDIWKVLEGYELTGKNCKKGKIIIPNKKPNSDINFLLTWIRTEGHLELKNTHIEINQQKDIKSLKKLKKLFNNEFKLNSKSSIFCQGKKGEDRLIISSSPLRQYLCIRYNLPLGYKSCSLKPLSLKGMKIEDHYKILAALIQTEGCLSRHFTRDRKKKLPRFEFIVKDKNLAMDCLTILRKFDFNVKISKNNKKHFKVALYTSNDVIRLITKTKKYLLNKNKIKHVKRICTNGIGL